MIDVIGKKQMYDSVVTGQNASNEWNFISIFLTSFKKHFVVAYACFMCICLQIPISCFFRLFWDKVWLCLVKTTWQPFSLFPKRTTVTEANAGSLSSIVRLMVRC